jgi:dienelactone hydrolase
MGREEITFLSGGKRIAAWWYAPDDAGPPPWPCVVMGHGFAAVKEARLDAFAERFAAVGLACVVFDYRHFGGSEGEPRQLLSIRRQLADWRAAIAYARRREDVDGARMALWGTSFGGGLVLAVLKRERGLRAGVVHFPLVDSLASAQGEGLWQTLRMGVAGLKDEARRLLGRPPYYIRTVGPPGSLAVLTTPGSEPGYLAIVRQAPSWRNIVAARIVIEMALFRPGRSTKEIACPTLFVAGSKDTVTPPKATIAAALRTPDARLMVLPTGHFDAYLGAAFEEAVSAEAAFLATHLGESAGGRAVSTAGAIQAASG